MSKWTPEPTVTGWYWMRFKNRYARRFCHDIVWANEGVWREEFKVHINTRWTTIDDLRHVAFSGPILPPGD